MGIRYWAGFRWSGWWVALLFLSATQVHATVDEIDLDPAPPSEPGPFSVLGVL